MTNKITRAKRNNSKRDSNTRKRKVGGNASYDCVSALVRVLPDKFDYERMADLESRAIDTTKTYKEFVDFQRATAAVLQPEECKWVKSLCDHIMGSKISNMDLEPCVPMKSVKLFYDKNRKLVIVNDR
jgi:hypothetical protein